MEPWIQQAHRHVRSAHGLITRPWTAGQDEFQAHLRDAAGCLRNAMAEGGAPAAEVEAFAHDLAAIGRLFQNAGQVNSAWLRQLSLLAGVYTSQAEASSPAPPRRISLQA